MDVLAKMQSTVIAADSVFMVCKNLPFEEGNCRTTHLWWVV
jgi:hypothetical protein